ncbi:TetR/AcrR family transcriptional regulator [Kiloniella sp.]|uniref:TetR/AcrR family transcriptional regulator n=1 Tax=Kiloniella sp. TaxID=1938587 RepID=UPI003B01766D
MDAAEGYIRTKGYNAFSFRDIAADVGIKTASIHYHFSSKADLGAAVAERYTERFLESLGPADSNPFKEQITRYISAFRSSYSAGDQMCLCGMLGAEISSLPENMIKVSKVFFVKNLLWLDEVYLSQGEESLTIEQARKKSLRLLALLEGGLIVARSLDGLETFDQLTSQELT